MQILIRELLEELYAYIIQIIKAFSIIENINIEIIDGSKNFINFNNKVWTLTLQIDVFDDMYNKEKHELK